MSIWEVLGEGAFGVLIFFFFVFAYYSLSEGEIKAFRRSLMILLVLIAGNISLFLLPSPLENALFGFVFTLVAASICIMFLSPKPIKKIEVLPGQKRIDERDVIFARFDYKEGTPVFEEYYERRPEYREKDDRIRAIPDILTISQIKKDPISLSLAGAEFDFLEKQLSLVAGEVSTRTLDLPPKENTRVIKRALKYLGADLCGICLLNKDYVYSHVGRGPEPYGQEIVLDHKYAVAFAVEMNPAMISSAPQAPVIIETGNKYVKAAKISIVAAHFIRRLGYPARAHIAGSNYQAVLPPLGWEAGLGELGRMGILITERFGPRVRLGLVTTDFPLVSDQPTDFGVQDFCGKCQKCARNCPAQAISYGEKTRENGVLKWVLDREECYRFWRKAGTDCAVCISVCPYSKPNNPFHRIIRKAASESSVFQSLSVWGDDFFYGRFPRQKKTHIAL